MRLLLDLGNTRLKWALMQPSAAEWLARGALDWHDDMPGLLQEAWAALPVPTSIVAASVVGAEREAQVTSLVAQRFGCEPRWFRTPASACGIHNAYADPQRLGADRFLAMVAAFAEGHAPCVLASVGTALTLDALAADGRHLGGLIAPGPRLMQQSLLNGTARVRPDGVGVILELADNTTDAVSSGCWQATVALTERFSVRMGPRLGGSPRLILDGGDAPTLAPLLSIPSHSGRDGVMRGLAVWAHPPSVVTRSG
ncbi:MAG: type III pantothenate kinase [Rhodanobacter sp.]|nr:MAG: type III pantothenate kinase [Rhodanobacter sp.]